MADSTNPLTAAHVESAAGRLLGVVEQTPLQRNDRLSAHSGAQVWLKREDLQPVRSYKLRGAYFLIASLTPEELAHGVVCASAGNHAQGVAYACQRLGVDGRVYLPTTTPRQKRDRISAFGGDRVQILVEGDTYDDAFLAAQEDAQRTGATMVPAFDDLRTISGQGTVAIEIRHQLRTPPDVLVIPVGGGGLLSGVITWIRQRCPGTRIVAVEPEGAASLAAALQAGGPVALEQMDTFVDGASVRTLGALTYPIIAAAEVEVMEVPVGAICTEMLALYQSDGIIAEPAGALASAALYSGLSVERGQTVVCLLTGGNNDVSRYGEVVERSLIHQGLKHYFLVSFPQEPGALRRFLDDVLGPDDDITLFEYVKRNNRETGPAMIGIEMARVSDLPGFLQRLEDSTVVAEHILPGSPLFSYVLESPTVS